MLIFIKIKKKDIYLYLKYLTIYYKIQNQMKTIILYIFF